MNALPTLDRGEGAAPTALARRMPPGLAGLLWERRPRRDHGFRRVMKELGRKLLWRFRIRGVRVSTSSLAVLQAQAKFRLHDEWSNDVPPDEDDCQRAGIVFQQENIAYIDRVLELLRHDTPLDAIVAAAARLRQAPDDFVARDEVDYDLRIRQHQAQQTEAALVGDLIRDYLKPDARGDLGGCVRAHRRLQLMNYAGKGRLGLGGEKAASIRDHPTPCEELWRRMSRAG